MLAAIATGHATAEDVLAWNPGHGLVRPEASRRRLYDRQYALYRQIYERTKDVMAQLPLTADAD
jgi:xylulokinase